MKAVVRTTADIIQFAHSVDLKDKPWNLVLTPFKRLKTLPQNKKVNVMIRELSAHCGYTESEGRTILKAQFGPLVERKTFDGTKTVTVPKSISDYTLEEASEFIEHLYQAGAEVGMVWQHED